MTGTTQFQTKSRLFPGVLLLGWPYISVNRENVSRNNFVLAQKSIDDYGYQMKYSDGLWTVVKPALEETKEIGSIEISSAPSQVLLDSIMRKLDGSVPDENVYFDIVWKDLDGNAISSEEAEERMLYESDCVFPVKTEYWESDDPAVLAKTDWGNNISLIPSASNPGRYYLQAEEGAKTGEYTFLFCSDYVDEPLDTVQDVKNLGNRILTEKRVKFLDQEPEPEETPSPTKSPVPTNEPVPTDEPVPTNEPAPTGEPVPTISPAPTGDVKPDPTVSPEPPEPEESLLPTDKPDGPLPPNEDTDKKPDQEVYQPAKIILSANTMVWTGKARKPKVTVLDTSGEVVDSRNYQVSYSNNVKPGQASAIVLFGGAYKGTMTKTFQIVPKGTTLSRLSSASRGFVVRWKRQRAQTSGYELQYSTNKKFSKKAVRKVMVKGNKKASKRITGRKPGKKYYVRIRTYKSVKGRGKTKKFYSAWSKVKTVRTR